MSPGIPAPEPRSRTKRRNEPRTLFLNALIVILVVVVAYLAYSLIDRHVISPPVESLRPGTAGQIIQLDVLNGCGIDGAASTVTGYLRARGFDVVEIRNYKTFDVVESMVIDRRGDLKTAERVAYALGINKKNVVQQISQDYYVDVSVVVGKDYHSLKPSQ
jgi:hypothetical protein